MMCVVIWLFCGMLHDGLPKQELKMADSAEVEVQLQDLDQIAADLTNGCHTSEETLKMERCDFTPKNKNIDQEQCQDMNEYVLSYFESLNSMTRRIIAEHRQVIEENKDEWAKLSPEQQDKLIDDKIVDPKIRKKYGEARFDAKPEWFPVLKLAHGLSDSDGNKLNLVNPRDSITSVTLQELHSRDQFSSPWSWASRSQEDLRILEEGELEARVKKVSEQDEVVYNPLPEYRIRKKFPLLEGESKNSSRTVSTQGSDPLSRKEFLDIEMEMNSKGNSIESSRRSSRRSSKASSASSDDSDVALIKGNTAEHQPEKQERLNENRNGKSTDESPLIETDTPKDMMAFLTNW